MSFGQLTRLNLLIFLSIVIGNSLSQQCHLQEFQLVNDRQVLNLSSPNFPNAYPPGTNCRYRIVAPMDYVVVASCRFEVTPYNCDNEYFIISLDGDYQLGDGERYCRSTEITRISNFRSMVVAYASLRPNSFQRGRFSCQISARRQPCKCGWSVNTRITNGWETMRHEFPFMVALKDINTPQQIFCGGSIISHHHILTAAHCTRLQPNPRRIIAFVGDHDLSEVGESKFEAQYSIQRIIDHPNYGTTPTTTNNDISILITTTPIEWSRGVGPICLPWRQQTNQFAYIPVDIAGWGTLSFAGIKSNTLQKAQLLTVENYNCQMSYNGTIQNFHLCTYDYYGLGQDSCQYDSGGPVVIRNQPMHLVGIISFGQICGVRFGTGVNTRITYYLGWLWSYVQNYVCVV